MKETLETYLFDNFRGLVVIFYLQSTSLRRLLLDSLDTFPSRLLAQRSEIEKIIGRTFVLMAPPNTEILDF